MMKLLLVLAQCGLVLGHGHLTWPPGRHGTSSFLPPPPRCCCPAFRHPPTPPDPPLPVFRVTVARTHSLTHKHTHFHIRE